MLRICICACGNTGDTEEKPKKKKAAAEKKVKDENQSTLDSFNFKLEAGSKRKASTDGILSDLDSDEDKKRTCFSMR